MRARPRTSSNLSEGSRGSHHRSHRAGRGTVSAYCGPRDPTVTGSSHHLVRNEWPRRKGKWIRSLHGESSGDKAKPISGLFCEVPKSNRLSFCETKPTSHLLSGKLHPFCVDSSAEPQPGGCRRGEQGKYGVNGQETSGSPASSTVPPAPRRDTCRAR